MELGRDENAMVAKILMPVSLRWGLTLASATPRQAATSPQH
jgi:hypothetical protein